MLVFIILVILLLALYIIVKKCLSDDNYDEKITEIKQPIEKNKNIYKIKYSVNLNLDKETCLSKANQNDSEALFELSYRYYYGIEIEKNLINAVKYAKKSAELENYNGKYFYYVLYYNLGENYGINREYAERCLVTVGHKSNNYEAKYYIGKMLLKDIFSEDKSYLTKNNESDEFEIAVVAIMDLRECFVAGRCVPPKTKYGDAARDLLIEFKNLLEILLVGVEQADGHKLDEYEAKERAFELITSRLYDFDEPSVNIDDLIKELS